MINFLYHLNQNKLMHYGQFSTASFCIVILRIMGTHTCNAGGTWCPIVYIPFNFIIIANMNFYCTTEYLSWVCIRLFQYSSLNAKRSYDQFRLWWWRQYSYTYTMLKSEIWLISHFCWLKQWHGSMSLSIATVSVYAPWLSKISYGQLIRPLWSDSRCTAP